MLLFSTVLWAVGCGPTVVWPDEPRIPDAAVEKNQLLDCDGAEAELCTGDPADAETVCRKALRSRDTAFHGHRCLAHIHLSQADTLIVVHGGGTTDDQLDTFKNELTTERREQLVMALDHVREGLVLEPASAPLQRVQLDILFRLYRIDELVAALPDALPYLDQEDRLAVRRYAERSLKADEVANARAILTGLVAAKEPDPEALAILGTLDFAAGDLDAARGRLRRALKAGASEPDIGYALVEVEAIRGDLQDVQSAARLVAERASTAAEIDHDPTWIALATDLDAKLPESLPGSSSSLIREIRNKADGASWGQLATTLAYESPMSGLVLSMAAQELLPLPLGPAVAQADVLRALGYPDRAAIAYADYLALVEDMEREGLILEGVVVPDQARLYGVEVLLDSGQVDNARAAFDRITTGGSPEYRFLGARVLAAEGQKKKALEWYREVLRAVSSGPLADAARREIDALKN